VSGAGQAPSGLWPVCSFFAFCASTQFSGAAPRHHPRSRERAQGARIEVRDAQGRGVADRYFSTAHGELHLKLPVMPAMLTPDEAAIRRDCLCYLMERYDAHSPQQQ